MWADGGHAYGLAQWHEDRQAKFAEQFKHDIRQSTRAEQIAFVDWELRNTLKGAGNKLAAAPNDTRQAAAIVRQYYEIPANKDGMEDTYRGDRADRIYNANFRQGQAPAMPVPQAQGPAMALNTAGQAPAAASPSTVRVEFGGDLPKGMNMRIDNPQKVDVAGPLVTRPLLLGANP